MSNNIPDCECWSVGYIEDKVADSHPEYYRSYGTVRLWEWMLVTTKKIFGWDGEMEFCFKCGKKARKKDVK